MFTFTLKNIWPLLGLLFKLEIVKNLDKSQCTLPSGNSFFGRFLKIVSSFSIILSFIQASSIFWLFACLLLSLSGNDFGGLIIVSIFLKPVIVIANVYFIQC